GRAEYDALARSLESLGALPRIDAAPDFVERTLARARRAAPASDRVGVPRPSWAPVAVAASLLFVAATLVAPWAGRGGHSTAIRHVAPQEARLLANGQHQPVVMPQGGATTRTTLNQDQVATLVDSLIDHTEDVDFVIDP